MNPPLAEKEASGFVVQYGMLHQSAEVLHIGRIFLPWLLGRLPFGEDDIVLVG